MPLFRPHGKGLDWRLFEVENSLDGEEDMKDHIIILLLNDRVTEEENKAWRRKAYLPAPSTCFHFGLRATKEWHQYIYTANTKSRVNCAAWTRPDVWLPWPEHPLACRGDFPFANTFCHQGPQGTCWGLAVFSACVADCWRRPGTYRQLPGNFALRKDLLWLS